MNVVQNRDFQYGGLNVRLFKSDKYGWVTTTPELAKACGIDRSTLERVCKKHNLVLKESVIEDVELGANLHPFQRGPKPKVFWTIEGMTFVAMYLGSETCEQFRNEVLKTIKSLEQQGFINSSEVIKRLETLENMVRQQQLIINHLTTLVTKQDEELRMYREANSCEASAAGKLLAAAKKTKHLRLVC